METISMIKCIYLHKAELKGCCDCFHEALLGGLPSLGWLSKLQPGHWNIYTTMKANAFELL